MIHIKTKLMMFFVILILLLSGLAFLLFQNNSRSIEQYNNILNRFFLLNEIYQKTIQVNTSIQAYALDPTEENELLHSFDTQASELVKYKEQLLREIKNDANYLLIKNYTNMIESFLEQGHLTVESVSLTHQSIYYDHMAQAGKISRFIQDSTLKLINNELSNYHSFYINMNNKNENYQKLGVYVFITAILLCTIFTFWFSEGITRPIQKLSLAARQISRGNFDVDEVSVTSRDELRFLTETFNGMCVSIRKLILEIKQKSELDTLVKKMELKSLQNQINPHFLFNTLNLVSKMAYVEGAERTSELVESISALLRYNLKKLYHSVVLRDEVNIIKEYFFIQKMRFGSRIHFNEHIEDSVLDCPLPSLTIQPLVENAFEHGVESYESGAEIKLSVYRGDGNVIVEISDNGVGMDEKMIKKILQEPYTEERLSMDADSNIEDENSNGIGMRNVLRRLQLFYQCQDIMEIESPPGRGTIVRLKLPQLIVKETESYV